ncbi:MAG: sugar ABC transporter permease [Candidatus Omnitrophica bacterium]|nr:sugar ABC transporter permease [Candidatus Omnitrophota bacterium]
MNKAEVRHIATNYIFILPAVALFALFWLYPFLKLFQLSVFEWDGILPWNQAVFVKFRHFRDLLRDLSWWQSMRQAGFITLIALTFQNALALALALACDKGIRAARAYRMIYFLPPVLAGIVVGLIWNWIFNPFDYGLLNYWLTRIGLGHLARAWLSEPKTALICVAIIHCWRGFGWGFIILLAGLQSIPRELYEAARIDGANAWESFKRVTIPLMVPVFVIVIILTILGTMQIYDIIIATTQGGPHFHTEVPITRMLAALRGSSRFGYASAMGIVFGLILFVVSIVHIKVSQLVKQE